MEKSYSRKFTSKITLVLTATIVVGITLGIHFSVLERAKPYIQPYEATTKTTEQGKIMNDIMATAQNRERALREAFGTKYSKTAEEIILTISKSNDSFAKGTVRFFGEIGGGWFLAAKVENNWTITAEGNGQVMCSDVESYSFPTDYVSECYDDETSSVVLR